MGGTALKRHMKRLQKVLLMVSILGLVGCGTQEQKNDSVVDEKNPTYVEAMTCLETGEYDKAYEMFLSISDYEDSGEMAKEAWYQKALNLIENGNYDEAQIVLNELSGYKNSVELTTQCIYEKSVQLYGQGEYSEAYSLVKTIEEYEGAKQLLAKCLVQQQIKQPAYVSRMDKYIQYLEVEDIHMLAEYLCELKDFNKAMELLKKCLDNSETLKLYQKCLLGDSLNHESGYDKISSLYALSTGEALVSIFEGIDIDQLAYAEAKTILDELAEEYYLKGIENFNQTKWGSAKDNFGCIAIINYKDSAEYLKKSVDNITVEMDKFCGVWIGTSFNLRIQEGRIHRSDTSTNSEDRDWKTCGLITYEEDEGTMSVKWTVGYKDDEYDVYVDGNTMTFKCTTLNNVNNKGVIGNEVTFKKVGTGQQSSGQQSSGQQNAEQIVAPAELVMCKIGEAYKDKNGLTVILNSYVVTEQEGYYSYKIDYTIKNEVADSKIMPGSFKLFYTDKTGEPQYGGFNYLFYGEESNRAYEWKVLKNQEVYVLEYNAHETDAGLEGAFFRDEPIADALHWNP